MANTKITADVIEANAVLAVSIADENITSAKLADLAVTEGKIANSAITAGKIATDAVITAKIQNGAITSAKLDTNIAVAGTLGVTGDANFDSNTLFVDASANAVGIGTSSPATALDVTGTITADDVTASGIIHLSSADPIVKFTDTAGGDTFGIFASASNFLGFYNFTDSRIDLVIDGSGNVGIGTSSPAYNLHVEKLSASGNVDLLVKNTGTDGTSNTRIMSYVGASGGDPKIGLGISGVRDYFFRIDNSDSDKLKLDTNGSDIVTIDISGNVGIGTSSPNAPLHIDAAGMGDVYSGLIQNSTTDTDHYNVVRFIQGASGSATGLIGTGGSATGNTAFRNNFVVGTQSSSPLVFTTNDTERMRVLSTGSVSISNDGSVPHSNSKFHVKGIALTMSDSAGNAGGGFQTFSGTKSITGTTAVTIFSLSRDNGAHTGIVMITKSDVGDSVAGIFSFSANYGNAASLSTMNTSTTGYTGFTLSTVVSTSVITFQLAHGNAGTTKNYTYTVLYGGNINVGTPTLY